MRNESNISGESGVINNIEEYWQRHGIGEMGARSRSAARHMAAAAFIIAGIAAAWRHCAWLALWRRAGSASRIAASSASTAAQQKSGSIGENNGGIASSA
jgi:hypothetical protein